MAFCHLNLKLPTTRQAYCVSRAFWFKSHQEENSKSRNPLSIYHQGVRSQNRWNSKTGFLLRIDSQSIPAIGAPRRSRGMTKVRETRRDSGERIVRTTATTSYQQTQSSPGQATAHLHLNSRTCNECLRGIPISRMTGESHTSGAWTTWMTYTRECVITPSDSNATTICAPSGCWDGAGRVPWPCLIPGSSLRPLTTTSTPSLPSNSLWVTMRSQIEDSGERRGKWR